MKPRFFITQSAFRVWLESAHETTPELWVGFYNKQSGKGGITYPEALDQALCFGWIDGLRKRVDDTSYTIRFTPRKPDSIWSAVNSKLEAAHEKRFKANKKAWDFFQAQAPWYRRTATWWVVSAKREETRLRRLATLMEDSEKGRRIALLTAQPRKKSGS